MHANQIRVRLAEEADAAPIAEIYRPFVESTPVTFEIVPPSAAEFAERIFAKVMPRYPWLVCERDGAVLGYAYANQFRARQAYDWSTEVSVYVGEGARRQGVARALYLALHELLVAQGFHRAIAGMTLPNPASAGFHEALGYTFVGAFPRVGHKQGAWHDVGFYSLDLVPDATPPAPLRTLDQLPGNVVAVALELPFVAALGSHPM